MRDKSKISPKIRQFISHLLRRAGKKAGKAGRRHMQEVGGITAREWGVLHLIHDQPQSQRDIAQALEITPGAIVIATDKLERRGYLKRTPNLKDRRQNLLKITSKGLDVYRSGLKAIEAIDQELFSALNPEELKAFHAALLKILES